MFVSAAWIVPAILGAVNELAQRRLSGQPPPPVPELLFASGDWLLYAFLTPGVFAISRRWPLSRPNVVRHAWVHLAMSLLFCVAQVLPLRSLATSFQNVWLVERVNRPGSVSV